MLLSYLRLVLFSIGLLIGVQVPGFISDYAKRVEAHLIEAQTGLSGFQGTAIQFFKGDMQALVAHYRASEDPIFRSDADSLSTLLTRQLALDKQFQAMQGPWYIRFLDRKSTRLNSSHVSISYAVFCLKKKRSTMYHSGIVY